MAKTKDDELQAILREVQTQLDDVLAGERDKLAKASPGEATSPELPPDTSATSPKDGASEASAPTDGGSPEASPEGTATSEETPGESTPGAPEGSADGGGEDPAAGGGADGGEFVTDPQALQAEYAKLPPEVLKAHYLACKAAMWSVAGQDDGSAGAAPDAGAPGAPAPDAAAAGAPPAPDAGAGAQVPPPAPDAGAGAGAGAPMPSPAAAPSPSPDLPPPAMKAEMKINAEANGGKVVKSERETQLETELAKTQELTKSLAALTAKLIEQPRRKAVTALSELGKSEPSKPTSTVDVSSMSRSEIIARLNEKACDESLKKSDRELMTSFCVGSIDVSKIAHLLA